MEGVSMYLHPEELTEALRRIGEYFTSVHMLMDCYSSFAAKASRYKNPINDVGVTQVYGLDEPRVLETSGLRFVGEHTMTPEEGIDELKGLEKKIFRTLYAGKTASKLYRLYEYRRNAT